VSCSESFSSCQNSKCSRKNFSSRNSTSDKQTIVSRYNFVMSANFVIKCTTRITYRVGQKCGPRTHDTIILSNFNRFKTFFTGRFLGKFIVKWIQNIPAHLAYVATLPCETLMSAKHAINDKLQGSVAIYVRCGGVVNSQIRKGLLMSVPVNLKKIGLIFGKVTSKNVSVSCTFFVF